MRYFTSLFVLVLGFGIPYSTAGAEETPPANLLPCGEFQGAPENGLPPGWSFQSPRPSLAPACRAGNRDDRQYLVLSGNGNPDCVGWAAAPVQVEAGKTYLLRTLFKRSPTLDPLQHLLFLVVASGATQGIAEFHRLENDWVEGEGRICLSGQGILNAEVRILYRLNAEGEAWIESVSLTETTSLPPRWVRIACTQGPGSLEEYGLKAFAQVLDAAGQAKADLVLLPEYINGEGTVESLPGPSSRMMSEKAAQYRMYVAGTIGLHDPASDRVFNAALLFDREGKLAGRYDKVHLYGPEFHWEGITPGEAVTVFQTDFGKVGFMTCFDSWFPDVAELVALKGADLLLFPNLGYDRALVHARALDNLINVVVSSRSGRCGVWDALGRDVLDATPGSEQNPFCKDVLQTTAANTGLLIVTLDLNAPGTLELNGGTRLPVPRGRRHLGNQRAWLEGEILREKQRWWTE